MKILQPLLLNQISMECLTDWGSSKSRTEKGLVIIEKHIPWESL